MSSIICTETQETDRHIQLGSLQGSVDLTWCLVVTDTLTLLVSQAVYRHKLQPSAAGSPKVKPCLFLRGTQRTRDCTAEWPEKKRNEREEKCVCLLSGDRLCKDWL